MTQDSKTTDKQDIFNSDLGYNLITAISSADMDAKTKADVIKRAFSNRDFVEVLQKSVRYAFSRKNPALYQKHISDGSLNLMADAYEHMMMLSEKAGITTPSPETLQSARKGDVEAQNSVKYWFWARAQDIAAKAVANSRFLEAPVTLTRNELVEYRKYRNRKLRTHMVGDDRKALAAFLDYSHVYVHLYADGIKQAVFDRQNPAFASLEAFTKSLFEHARDRVQTTGVHEFTFDSAVAGFLRLHCDSYALSQLRPIAELDRIHLNVPFYKSGQVLSLDMDSDDDAPAGHKFEAETAISTQPGHKTSHQEHVLTETITSILNAPAPIRMQVLEELYDGRRNSQVAENHLKVIHSLVIDQNTLQTPVKSLSENTSLDPKTVSKITSDILTKSDAFLVSRLSGESVTSISEALLTIHQNIKTLMDKEIPTNRRLRQPQVTAIPLKASQNSNQKRPSLRAI